MTWIFNEYADAGKGRAWRPAEIRVLEQGSARKYQFIAMTANTLQEKSIKRWLPGMNAFIPKNSMWNIV